ncbi:caspase family protein [Nodosilinea sp. P-1105]|uniref:caspase family protein n=1 Tax=Nodosilinea sp. P-1105 TaxID=2546229 RepID=UPI00146AB79C|nr:caspase family protein [Nodosilinea sp. P-1105]NMF84523.1 hypothetical protein [Nodosilinea sp. P-1105]
MPRYALVIGIQKYSGSGFQDLEKSTQDAEAVAQVLEKYGNWEVTRLPQRWNAEKQNWNGGQGCYEVAPDVALTGAELGAEISQFFEHAGRNEALIYFSGHGYEFTDSLAEITGYLVASDCTATTVSERGLSLESLNKLVIRAACSSVVVLLDCCHAGRLLERSLITRSLTAFQQGDRNYFLAAACRGHEKAYEGPEFSLFTKVLLDGLASPGRDGRVLASHVNTAIDEGLSGSGQEPVVLSSGGAITLATYGARAEALTQEEDALQTILKQLGDEKKYDVLDAAFFEAVAARVASNQARAQMLRLPGANWSMLFQGNYVERDQQGVALQQTQRLAQQPGISLMLIRGEPGAGKTALLRWLAHELVGQGKRVLHKQGTDQAGWLEELLTVSEATGGEHFYVITDDVFRDETILEELEQTELFFPLTIIATTRPNEDRHTELDGTGYETICLDLNKPSQAEKERILALPEVQSHLVGKSNAEREVLLDSPIMLVLMLQLSEGKPFDAILRDIVKSLPSSDDRPIYQAYGILCSFFQYNVIVPFEVLRLCLPAGNWSEQLILTELEGLVETTTYAGYEGLFPIHELIAKTVMDLDYRPGSANQPYAWSQPPLLEQNLHKIVPGLDASEEMQERWLRHSIRLLTLNGSVDLVGSILKYYTQEIEAVQQQGNTISSWVNWHKVYTLLNRRDDQNRCLDALLGTQPQTSWECSHWLSRISKSGTEQQRQDAIETTQTWLQQHPDDSSVRTHFLAFLSQWGTDKQRRDAIDTTQPWLQQHPDDSSVRTKFLGFLGQWGTDKQRQDAIDNTQIWLQQHPEDTNVRTQFLAFLSQWGTDKQRRDAIDTTQTWLQQHPDDSSVRTHFLAFLSQWGTDKQRQDAIDNTQNWLQHHIEDNFVRRQFLTFLERWGTEQQMRDAIDTTQTWLQQHPEDSSVRTQFLAFIGKQGDDIKNIEDLIIEQWHWLRDQRLAPQSSWEAFLPVLYHHASPDLYQPATDLVLQQHLGNKSIQNLIFGYFRDYLDQVTCYALATNVTKSNLPPDKWQNYIHAANFFRDQGEFEKAEKIYRKTFGAARAQVSQIPQLSKTIDFINLSYAELLLLTESPSPDAAIKKINWVLKKNSKHGYAHLLMTQAFQIKGESCYGWAIAHFEQAIKFDNRLNGFMYCQLGQFYRYTLSDIPAARNCYENSIGQQVNLPACVELAELEIENGNLERAKSLLEQGLALPLLKRTEQEMRDKLSGRIALLRQQTGL